MLLLREKISPSFTKPIQAYFEGIKNVIDSISLSDVEIVIDKILKCYHRDGYIYIFGNGGSSSTASHFENDFNKGVSETLKKKFRVHCLNDNIPMMLSVANDIGYDQVFINQLKNFLRPDDSVIGISGSGNSINVIHGTDYANKMGAETIAWVGFDGGILKKKANYSIHIEVNNMQYVEDCHLILNHLIMSMLTNHLMSNKDDN